MAKATVLAVTAGAAAALDRPAVVVRRPSGEVVMILVGRDALPEAATWRARGYQVEMTSGQMLGAA